MRKIHYALLTLLLFAACKKSDLPEDSGCISQIARRNFRVAPADSVIAIQLLKQNNLQTNNLQFEYITLHDTVLVGGTSNVYQYIFAIQYLNGLPVLSYDFGYTFKDGIFKEVTGAKYNGVNLNTHPTQSLPRLRELFITEINKNKSSDIAATFKDSCLVAQFGYYDLNVDITVLTNDHTPNFVKAWSVTPKHSAYPLAIFRDDNGQIISYTNGIVVFN